MRQHILHLKRHRNVLYGIVAVLLILQIGSSLWLSTQLGQIQAYQQQLAHDTSTRIDEVQEQNQFRTQALSREIGRQRTEIEQAFELQIEELKSQQADFSAVIEEVIPGVVSISTDRAGGSGFIISASGYIVTNYHVIDGADFVKVMDSTNREYDARVVGGDPAVDIALLKVEGVLLHRLELADSDSVAIGDKVIAIGNPLGLSFTVTEGIVSAVHRRGPNGLDVYTQTDVTLNPGNSGGPLIDREGKVIGVNNFKIGGAEGLGFAIESNAVREIVRDLSEGALFGNA